MEEEVRNFVPACMHLLFKIVVENVCYPFDLSFHETHLRELLQIYNAEVSALQEKYRIMLYDGY